MYVMGDKQGQHGSTGGCINKLFEFIFISMYVYVYVYIYMYILVPIYVYICIYIYIYIYELVCCVGKRGDRARIEERGGKDVQE